MSYSERDLPVHLRDGDILVLDDGTEVRWESSGEAKAVFLGSNFTPLMEKLSEKHGADFIDIRECQEEIPGEKAAYSW